MRRASAAVLLVLAGMLLACGACGPQSGARPLKEVRKKTAALRSHVLLELAGRVHFPHCDKRPTPQYPCGLLAERATERALLAACAEQPECVRQGIARLFGQVQELADSLDVSEIAVLARCGPRCRDLKALELEVIRTAAAHAEQRARAAFVRADDAEREGIEREREELAPFLAQKKLRDDNLDELLHVQARDVAESERDGASLPHTSLCVHAEECGSSADCMRFSGAEVGICQKE